MAEVVYRFLPWARRGLASAIPPAPGGSVPSRADIEVEVVVGGLGTVPTGATLSGPGDIVGLDPTTIVRTIPRPDTTNAEPNLLAAVDFDQPELPWAFTPTAASADGKLRPWLVLVVVRDRPGVSITLPNGALLPILTIDDKADEELPNLSESWAWAHAQLLDVESGASADSVGSDLAEHPERNVSRLVCPRRLEANARWIACLVPAFDAGAVRGLGGSPQQTALSPAWTAPESATLPVYYHWTFQTGPEGDFESLVRRLRPIEAEATIGRVIMHVADASAVLEPRLEGDDRYSNMDGALRAPKAARVNADPPVADAALSQVPDRMRVFLQDMTRIFADAADGKLDGVEPGDTETVGPPVYGGRHARRTTVTDADLTWLQELNTDPRGRVAAFLGADVIRKYQDDVMAACWEQVGDILATEAALSRARLSLEVGRRFRARHLAPLADGRFLQVTAPVASRILLGGISIPAAIGGSSLPDRIGDPAMRRYTSARGRVLAGVARRARTPLHRDAGERLVATLAKGREDVDATRFLTTALDGLPAAVPRADEGRVSLERFGLRLTIDTASAAALGRAARDLAAAPFATASERLKPRPDLRRRGMVTSAHTSAARRFSALQVASFADISSASDGVRVADMMSASTAGVLDTIIEAGANMRGNAGFLLQTGAKPLIRALDVQRGGRLVVVDPSGSDDVTIALVDARLDTSARSVGDLVGSLPDDTFSPLRARPGGVVDVPVPVNIEASTTADHVVGRSPVDLVGPREAATFTMPPLVTDSAVLTRYREALSAVAESSAIVQNPPISHIVPFAISVAVTATLQRTDPDVVHPARLDTALSFAGHRPSELLADPAILPAWNIGGRLDRVMAYPVLGAPAYEYLAKYDRTRFCPGIDAVPPESITLLATNPRFIAAFMAGLNYETNRELLWRGFPTDERGTSWQRFWRHTDGSGDIEPMHTWRDRPAGDDLAAQTTAPDGNLVLLLRGDLIRRYPRTMAVATPAVLKNGVLRPSEDPDTVVTHTFAGTLDPDVAFFGFPLTDAVLTSGNGWFFGLLEPVTEPRFGFDDTIAADAPVPTVWNDVAWPHLQVPPGSLLSAAKLSAIGSVPPATRADLIAAALFQRPFKLLVHARHLVEGI
jgi:hypothetical protein